MHKTLVIVVLLLGAGACGSDDEGSDAKQPADCQPSAVNSTLIYCSESWTQCTDGKTYEVECQGGPGAWVCKCRIDGTETASEAGTDYCDVQPVDRTTSSNELCGWSIQ